MKPYLAILIDSYWEAVGNRVLWVLLIGWALVLTGLAPFGYVTERSFNLVSSDIDNFDKIKDRLNEASQGKGNEAVKAVAAKMDPGFLEQLKPDERPESEQRGRRRIRSTEMAKELNAAIGAKDLYSAAAFPTADKRDRLKPLIEQGVDKLGDFEREELNRELLQLAFPLELARPRSERLWIGYAGFKLGEPLNISRRQIKQFVEPLLLGFLIKLGLGVVAVFVALIVTSPIVPETFRSGSLHLLLSKPISRIWLYLAKLLGGCIFVFFNITFVLIGLYFIAGIRFDIWNEGLLYCIPLLLFVFIVFYSMSALVGLIWGNAIVCVVACIIFWLFCFAVGAIHDGMQQHVELLPQISRIDKINDKYWAVNQRGDVSVWNDKFTVWQPALDNDVGGQGRTFGPLYDPERKQIVVKSFFRIPFGNLAARSRKVSVIRLSGNDEPVDSVKIAATRNDAAKSQSGSSGALNSEASSGEENAIKIALLDASSNAKQDATEDKASDATESKVATEESVREANSDPQTLAEARSTPYWMSDTGPELPQQLIELTQVSGDIVAICRGGIYRLNWDKDLSKAGNNALVGMLRNWVPGVNAFESVAPKDFVLSDNASASTTADGNGLVVYSSGNVDLLKYAKNRFEVAASVKIEGEGTEPALVIANQQYCVVARDTLPIMVFDGSLKPVHAELTLPEKNNARQLAWIPGTNDAAIITHTGNWFKLDCQTGKLTEIASPFTGLLTTMTWQSQGDVLLGVKPNRVVEYELAQGKVIKDFKPKMSTLEMVYNWGVNPVYQVNPKPSALDNAMGYLLSGNATQSMSIVTADMEQAQVEIDVWRPIITNLVFVAVMLLIGCVYVARKEF